MGASRRDLLRATSALAAASAPAAVTAGPVTIARAAAGIPGNLERARRLMREAGVTALVGATEANAFWLTGLTSLLARMSAGPRLIGVLPADASLPVVAVLSTVDIARAAAAPPGEPDIVAYSTPAEPDRWTGRAAIRVDEAVPARTMRYPWRTPPDAALSALERAWNAAEAGRARFTEANPELATRRVLAEFGLGNAPIAVDDPGFARALVQVGRTDTTIAPAHNLFLRARLVKSPVEAERLRVAARRNGEAARATIAALASGMSNAELEARFFAETVLRGGRPEFVVAGTPAGLRRGGVTPGEPFLFDAVARYDGYIADWARTAVLGEPSAEVLRRTRLLGRLADTLTAELRPGQGYAQVRERATALLAALGGDFPVAINPHSIGLDHSEDVLRDDLPFATRAPGRVEAGMVLTIDLPTVEPGWGSTHIEAPILVGPDGGEWLDRADDPLLVA